MRDKRIIVNEVLENSEKLLSILNNFDIKDLTEVKKLFADFKEANIKENLEYLNEDEIEKLNNDLKIKLESFESLLIFDANYRGK